jgi:hypothetical protein
MASAGDAGSLKAAVCALYGPAGEDLARANAWLNAFSQTPAAWEACVQLLDPTERPEVSFFCSNLLLSKVRSEWHKLTPEQASSMGSVIRYARLGLADHAFLYPGHGQAGSEAGGCFSWA